MADPKLMIDWDGLKRDLGQLNKKWEAVNRGLALDVEGIWKDLGYNEEQDRILNKYKTGVSVDFGNDGTPWYEAIFVDAPKWIADKSVSISLMSSPLTYLVGIAREVFPAVTEVPELQKNVARNRLKDMKQTEGATEDYGVGEVGLGVEEGFSQFTQLLIGARATTLLDHRDKMEMLGMARLVQNGEITKDDYKEYLKWFNKNKNNIPLIRDVAAGITNSLLIMGSLVASGGIASFTTRGLKFGSSAWLKAWGKGMLAQGIKTWKLMGGGATVGAMHDSIMEMKDAKANGNTHTFWDFMADVGMNMSSKHSQAFLEGMSEGILLEMRLGSVPLKKWLGKEIIRKVEGKVVKEFIGIRQLRRLLKAATTPELKTLYQTSLKEALNNRKQIAKLLAQNFGKKIIQGLGIETATEQVTDAFQDLTTKNSHSSALWLAFGDDEAKKSAFRNLVVEAAVGLSLGTGMGLGDIWSTKPIEEIAEKYGEDVAREVERTLNGEKDTELQKAIRKAAKNPNSFNADVTREQNNVEAITDQGKGQPTKLISDPENKPLMDNVKRHSPATFKMTIDAVDDLASSNVLDYVVEQGRQELKEFFKLKSAQDSKKDATEDGENKGHLYYNLNSYLMDTNLETVHAITSAAYRDVIQLAAERGLIDRVNWTKPNESHIRKDLALGIALNFSETGWAFLKHKYTTNENIDFMIEEARKLSASNIALTPNDKFGKQKGPQTIQSVQDAARLQYKQSIGENIGNAMANVGSIIDAEVGIRTDEEIIPNSPTVQGGIVDADAIKDTEDDYDLSQIGVHLDDDYEYQTAYSLKELTDKIQQIANVMGIQYRGYNPYGDLVLFQLYDGITSRTFFINQHDVTYRRMGEILKNMRNVTTKMAAVAYQIDEKTYIGEPGEIHAELLQRLPEEVERRGIAGFADKNGKFYTREEAKKATGIKGESIAQGIAPLDVNDVEFETSLPGATFELPKYSSILEKFRGNTVRDLVEYLTKQGSVNPANVEVASQLLEHIGDRDLSITPMDPKHPGATNKTTYQIHINPNAVLWNGTAVWDTLTHEMMHSYLHGFMHSDTLAAKTFNGKILGVLNLVRSVLNAPKGSEVLSTRWMGDPGELEAWKQEHRDLIRKAFSSTEEFITSVMSDTQRVKYLTDNINAGGPKARTTGWRKIWQAIHTALEKVGIRRSATKELQNILERQHKDIQTYINHVDTKFSPRTARENRRLARNVTSGYEETESGSEDDVGDLLDPEQKLDDIEDEDENELENASIENFTQFMSTAWNIREPAFREYVKGLSDFQAFVKDTEEIDNANKNVITNKINHLYRSYKSGFRNAKQFKKFFLKRQYLNIISKSAKDTFIYMGIKENDPDTGQSSFRYELRHVKGSYRDGNGKKRNTYRRTSAIEGYVEKLNSMLGLDPNTLQVAYIDGFEQWQGNKVMMRSNMDRLDPRMFGVRGSAEDVPVTGFLADALWSGSANGATNVGMLYLGSFSGKNTLPVLWFDSNQKIKIREALNKFGARYQAQAIQEFQGDYSQGNPQTNPLTEARQLSSYARALLEDMWFNAKTIQDEVGGIQLESEVITKDWNKIQKRGTKWNAMDTGIILSEDEIEEEFGNAPINGIKFQDNDAIINAAVISSVDDGMITFKTPDGRTHTLPMNEVFTNELGTSLIDGASFYIVGHFDKAYRLAHAALKDGALKNLYASRVGDDPLFIKHAMHGVSADSPIGQWMINHNIAVLVADESMKEGPRDKIVSAAEFMDKQAFDDKNAIMPLKLSQFTRVSESEYKDTRGGTAKQFIGGSAYSDVFNDIIKSAVEKTPGDYKVSDVLKNFSDAMTQEAVDWIKQNSTDEALYDILRDIVYNPRSPQEQSVSDIWLDFIEPLEGQEESDVIRKYSGAFHHAHTAEVMRNRLQHRLAELLAAKTAGMRGALDPNLGWMNYDKDVSPIIQNWNLGNLLVNMEDVPSQVKQAAFPESGLQDLAQQLIELQRRETRAHAQLKDDAKTIELADIEQSRSNVMRDIKDLNISRLATIITNETTRISPHSLINWDAPEIEQWKDEVVFGTKYTDNETKEQKRAKNGILNEDTGRLREGWVNITEDIADALGIKPGDWTLAIVTPTDSPTGVIGVRVAGIAKSKESKRGGRKVSDKNKMTFNSEWLQSIVGKDFDIDTISLLVNDPKFWRPDEFKFLAQVANKVPNLYVSRIVEETKSLFKEKGIIPKNADGEIIDINKNTVLDDTVRELYSIAMNGVPRKKLRRRFSIMGGTFIELDSAYLHSPAPIINERLFHTALSTINMRSEGVTVPFITNDGRLVTQFKREGKTVPIQIDFDVLNPEWMRTHINHLHMTNAEVDFPNKTTRLAYVSDPKSKRYRIMMGGHFWGLGGQKNFLSLAQLDLHKNLQLQNLDNIMRVLKTFQKEMFDDAFNLARRRNTDTFEKLDYYATIQQLRRAQTKLKAIAEGDITALQSYVNKIMERERRLAARYNYPNSPGAKAAELLNKQKEEFLNSFIQNLKVDNVYDYPLFNTIRNIDIENFPLPGNTYKDHLVNQVLASLETMSYYPMVRAAYNDTISHARSEKGKPLYTVGERIAYKPAYRVLQALGDRAKNPVKAVHEWLSNTARLEARLKTLKPSELQDFKEAMEEFKELDRRIGKPFQPFERDGQLVHVDAEAIAMARMAQSLDYMEPAVYINPNGKAVSIMRGKLPRGNARQYWEKQLRTVRMEANSILHAFDEKSQAGASETLTMIRSAHSVTMPLLWKAMLDSPFLFLNPSTAKITLYHNKTPITLTHNGGGTLTVLYNGKEYSHSQINEQGGEDTKALYRLFTERDGLWEGIGEHTQGTFNRSAVSDIITMARNLTMETRTRILEKFLAEQLYDSLRGFTRDDQIAFWIGILSQVSDQGMLERKATGFIVNQSPYNPVKPFKFQTNHVALNLLSKFEPELLNVWLQHYSLAQTRRNPYDIDQIAQALLTDDSNVDMLYQDAPTESPEATTRHFFNDYVNEHNRLAKDASFLKFYKFMRGANWKDGLQKLRDLTKNIVMLKALSENGVFYQDLVRDINKLTDKEFYKKYSKIDINHIRLAIERYAGQQAVEEFIRQRAGESDVDFRTRGNIISLYYTLNGVKKREGVRNKKLTFMRKLASNVVGYDMVAMLGEKQTRALHPKDEIVGTIWDTDGPRTMTTHEAQLAMRTHATRTFIPVGESVVAITKGQRLNRTLAIHQVTLNNQAKRYEDVIKLMSDNGFRDKWRVKFTHKKADKREPHTNRTKYIAQLIDQIPESDDTQLEVRRDQVFKLAENLKKSEKIFVEEDIGGAPIYKIQLGSKTYAHNSVSDLIEERLPNLKPIQKLALVGALDMRIMYDMQVPKFLRQAVSYLERTRSELEGGQNIDSALKVDAMIRKYRDMFEAITRHKGDYMPHQFPIARYREMWMKGYLEQATAKILDDIKYHKKNKTGNYLSTLDPIKDKKKIRELAVSRANKVWDKISAGWNRGAVIPNFLPRRMPDAVNYTRTDPTVHFNYITKLIEGLKKDGLLVDWLNYQANARLAGERSSIIELTRDWYANQIGDKQLRTTNIKWHQIKPGQEITFTQPSWIISPSDDLGYWGTSQVNGVVQKITNDEVHLNIDTEHVLWQAKQDLARWDKASLMMLGHGEDAKATQRQWITLQNFINKGYLKQADFANLDMTQLSELQAATLLIKGIKRVIADPSKVGVYKRTGIWGNDVAGNAQSNTVEKYSGHGTVERLRAKEREAWNLQMLGSDYTGASPRIMYNIWKTSAAVSSGILGSFKKLTGLFFMGLAASPKARVVNQMGAFISNLIDSPLYNAQRWREGSDMWSRIRHGNIELMDVDDAHLYKTLVGLGLTENNNILAIALEAANIKPEDMLINDAKPAAIKWLATLFRDATKYDSTYKALKKKTAEKNLETDPIKAAAIQVEINQIKLKWQARVHNLLSKSQSNIELTNLQEKELWKKVNELSKSAPKINIAEEQGFTATMAAKLMAKVAWKSFFTSNLGMGFQAKAERLRIPAFFIGYTTAIRMGYSEEEAIQLGVNSVELRHAFYGSANKQFGANTKVGTVAFQYAQYQYNSISKMIRIMREIVPQMLRFAHNRPETTTRLKHMSNMLKLVQESTDAKGKALKKGQINLKEINLLHGILMKVGWTAVMMQLGTRIFYGITNFQDPVGQVVYKSIDFVIDLIMGGGLDLGDDDDMDKLAWAIQDAALPLGLLYKMGIQGVTSAPTQGINRTYFRGRVDDTFDFVWRVSNSIDQAAYQLGISKTKPNRRDKLFFDVPWLVDDFGTGIKLIGWTAADDKSTTYTKRGLYYGFKDALHPYFSVENRRTRSFGGGRYVETRHKGISLLGDDGSKARWVYLLDPLSYIPFLDRIIEGR